MKCFYDGSFVRLFAFVSFVSFVCSGKFVSFHIDDDDDDRKTCD